MGILKCFESEKNPQINFFLSIEFSIFGKYRHLSYFEDDAKKDQTWSFFVL